MSEYEELAVLVARSAEGALDDADATRLAAMLRGDAGAVDAYVSAMLTGAMLNRELSRTRPTLVMPAGDPGVETDNSELGTRNAERSAVSALPISEVPSSAFRVPRFVHAVAAALLVAGAAAAIYIVLVNSKPETRDPKPAAPAPIATVIDTESTGGVPLNAGDALYDGPVPLERGTIDLMMNSGVSVALTGPGEFELIDAMSVRVTRGRARCVVPPGAIGFTVATPDGVRIVDLGTEFIVRVDEMGRSFVGVLRGRVRIDRDRPDDGGVERELATGEAAVVDGGEIRPAMLVQGSIVVESIRVDPVTFNAAGNRLAEGDEAPGLTQSIEHSPLVTGDEAIEEVFGRSTGGVELGNAIFADAGVADNGNGVIGDGDETVDWVEWRTAEPVTLGGYRVELATDGAEPGAPRCVRMLRLIVEGRVVDTADAGGVGGEVIRLFEDGPVTGRRFRLEFTRGTSGQTNAGPRVIEIDAVNVTPTAKTDSTRNDPPADVPVGPETELPAERNPQGDSR